MGGDPSPCGRAQSRWHAANALVQHQDRRLTDRRLRGVWDDGEGVVRGFSIAGIGEQVCRAGLTLCDVTREEPDGGSAKAFFDGLAQGLAAIGIDPEEYSKRAAASHLICRVRKTPI